MPKKPVSSFLLYAKTLDRGEASVIDFIKGASQKWKVLPVQEKEVPITIVIIKYKFKIFIYLLRNMKQKLKRQI
jgi:hypothetical protein